MKIDRIEAAVIAVCEELHSQVLDSETWHNKDEQNLFREVVASILGSQVSFEMAIAATDALEAVGLLEYTSHKEKYCEKVLDVLCQPLSRPEWHRDRRYRFPKVKSEAISETAIQIYGNGGSITELLEQNSSAHSARRVLIDKAKGVGPKQASMLLRNIGFSDELAILDSHLLRFMDLFGLRKSANMSVSNLKNYEKTEKEFLAYSETFGWPTGILDQAIWVVMRVCRKETQWVS